MQMLKVPYLSKTSRRKTQYCFPHSLENFLWCYAALITVSIPVGGSASLHRFLSILFYIKGLLSLWVIVYRAVCGPWTSRIIVAWETAGESNSLAPSRWFLHMLKFGNHSYERLTKSPAILIQQTVNTYVVSRTAILCDPVSNRQLAPRNLRLGE